MPTRTVQLDELHHQLAPNTRWQQISLGLFAFLTSIPAIELNGFGDLLPHKSLAAWAVICALFGALFGALYYPDRRWWAVGVLPGALMGLLSLGAVYYYTQSRHEVFSAELFLIALIAMLPGMALYYVLMRALALED